MVGESDAAPFVRAVTLGCIEDLGIKDANNMGAAMAPAAAKTISRYLAVRPKDGVVDRNALFLSNRGTRIKPITVEVMVKKYLEKIGLSGPGYSVHKLRHTAATLMYRYGNVDIRVLQDILGHTNLGTTEIYTHTSSSQMEQAVKANPLAKVTERRKKPKREPGTGTSTPAGDEDTEK